MPEWVCEITIIEHHRLAHITADTKREALEKIRKSEWDFLDDATSYTVRKSGKLRESR